MPASANRPRLTPNDVPANARSFARKPAFGRAGEVRGCSVSVRNAVMDLRGKLLPDRIVQFAELGVLVNEEDVSRARNLDGIDANQPSRPGAHQRHAIR